MRKGEAIVERKGIRFNNCYYDCERANIEDWYVIARKMGSWKVEIRYDSRNMDYIYIVNKDCSQFEICKIKEHQELFKSKTFEELLDYNKYLIEEKIKHEEIEDNNTFKMNVGIINDIKEAKNKTKYTHKNKKDLRKNRKEEKENYGKNQALSLVHDKIENLIYKETRTEDESKDYLLDLIDGLDDGVVENV